MAEAAKAVSAGTWELIADFASYTDKPRGYRVSNYSTSANRVEVYVVGMRSQTAAPGEPAEGLSLAPGESQDFIVPKPGGITAVYARSTGATITHGEVVA